MELTDLVRQYTRKRDDFVGRISHLTRELTAWTEEHCEVQPSLMDIARFEAIRAERSRLLSEFTEAEDEFVVQMLRNVGSSMR